MEKMKAVVVYSTKNFKIEKVDKPVAHAGEIIIKIEAAGICAGDRSMFFGTAPWGEIREPVILGHEYVGTVVELGEGTRQAYGLELGDRCLAEFQIPCGKCYYCKSGLTHLCIDSSGFLVGAWAEYMRLRCGAVVHKVPKSIDKLSAAMIEPLTCAAHGIERANISMKDTVVISGMGAIGLGMIQFARLKTPYKLIGLDVNDEMLNIARSLGADYTFNPLREDVKNSIDELTQGIGADIYIEASGNSTAIGTGLSVLRKRGRMVAYGVYTKEAHLDFNQVSEYKELEIVGGHLSPGTYPFVIQCLERKLINTEPLITDIYSFDDFSAAINAKTTNKNSIKTVLVPHK